MIDALGFKGIWGDPAKPKTDVLESLKRIGRATRVDRNYARLSLQSDFLPDAVVRLVKAPLVKVLQLSDTMVVAAGRRKRARGLWKRHAAEITKLGFDPTTLDDAVDGYMRFLVCKCVCRILRTAALCNPALVYRGVVTCGQFAIDRNFLLGPAVDEAASLIDLADGPFVWLAPSANQLPHAIRHLKDDPWQKMKLKYDVPLKGGQKLPTRVLNPLAFCRGEEDRKRTERSMLAAMASNRIDVVVKRGNALTLFDRIRRDAKHAAILTKYKAKAKADAAPAT